MENFAKFNPRMKVDFPPYKNGKTMLEYFYDYYKNNRKKFGKNYLFIPIFWNFLGQNNELQNLLDKLNNKNFNYFVVDNSDGKIKYNLPLNTISFGCTGEENYIIPLLYEDNKNTLEKYVSENNPEKIYLASFIGGITHGVRNIICNKLKKYNDIFFDVLDNNDRKKTIQENAKLYKDEDKYQRIIGSYYSKEKVDKFIINTSKSFFCIAPRGIGRQSYRFYEAIKLDTIPIYIWDDIECLPYKDDINYDEFSISINIKDIDNLYDIMIDIINSGKYEKMIKKLREHKKYFELDFMCDYISNKIKSLSFE